MLTEMAMLFSQLLSYGYQPLINLLTLPKNKEQAFSVASIMCGENMFLSN